MKLAVIIGLILGVCLLRFLHSKIPKFRITFTRVFLLCALCITAALVALKFLVIICAASIAIFAVYLFFKIKAR